MSFADYVFKNGRVITVNEKDDLAESVAVTKNKISYVGSNEDVKPFIGEMTKVVDLQGRSLTPGFIDCHMHPVLYGLFGGFIVDITYPICRTIAEIKGMLRERAKTTPKGQWIQMWGYDQNKLKDKRHVTMEDLDEVTTDHPVECMRICGHLGVYNTPALGQIGVYSPADAEKFGENEIVVENGKLTGMAKDNTNFLLWSKIKYSDEDAWDALKRVHEKMLKTGITSIHYPGDKTEPTYKVLKAALKEGWFKVREYAMVEIGDCEVSDCVKEGKVTGNGDDKFRYGAMKIYVDGGTSGPSCATREPYSHDPKLPGIVNYPQEFVTRKICEANAADCQMTAHAVGDKAVEMMLTGYEKALGEHPRKDPRHRIEHCGLTDEKLIKRLKNLDIIPVSNTHFLTINGSDYKRYFGDRVNYMFAMRSYLDAGLKAVIGCDAPTADELVMRGIDGAVNRIDRRTGEKVGAGQAISIMEAIRCYTINGAYASFEESIKGSLEVGKLADMVMLSEDILSYPQDKVMDIRIDMTMIDGEVVYHRD